jgi:hypothetical protein
LTNIGFARVTTKAFQFTTFQFGHSVELHSVELQSVELQSVELQSVELLVLVNFRALMNHVVVIIHYDCTSVVLVSSRVVIVTDSVVLVNTDFGFWIPTQTASVSVNVNSRTVSAIG